jgi:hypothetical protein
VEGEHSRRGTRRSRSVLLTFGGMSLNLADDLNEPGLRGREGQFGVGPGRWYTPASMFLN